MKRVLVTGSTGLVGEGICRYFLKDKWNVFGTSRREIISHHKKFSPIKFDLGSKNDLDLLNAQLPFKAIIHNAAKLPHSLLNKADIENYYLSNVKGTRQLLDWAIEKNIETFIYISGTGVFMCPSNGDFKEESPLYPNPNHYPISKAMGEILCRAYNEMGLKTVILRISGPYGFVSNQSVIPKFLNLVKKDKNIELWGNGSRSQVFTFVEDVGFSCKLAIENPAVSGTYNITGNESTTMSELANKVKDSFPKTNSKIIFSNTNDPEEEKKRNIPILKAKREMNFEPQFSLSSGLKQIINSKEKAFWSYK